MAVYPTRDAAPWLARLAGERIHRGEQIGIFAIDPKLITDIAARLERRMDLDLSVSEQTLYVSVGADSMSGTMEQLQLT